jgi:hypothetical protein
LRKSLQRELAVRVTGRLLTYSRKCIRPRRDRSTWFWRRAPRRQISTKCQNVGGIALHKDRLAPSAAGYRRKA